MRLDIRQAAPRHQVANRGLIRFRIMCYSFARYLMMRRELHTVLISRLEGRGLNRPLAALAAALPRSAAMYVVGGFARDCARACVERRIIEPKDADLVVATDSLASALAKLDGEIETTLFGGFRWTPPGAATWIDVWQLKDTLWIKSLHLTPAIESFLAGVDLNLDRIAVGLNSGEVIDGGCLQAIERRLIDLDAQIRLRALAEDELARAIVLHLKTGYALSAAVMRRLESAAPERVLQRAAARLEADRQAPAALARVADFLIARRDESAAAHLWN
jgi:hypothetical protein